MADYSKIINHPDSEEIVGKLVNGVKAKTIVDWLKLRYPELEQAHLRLGAKLLKDFTDNTLDLQSAIKKDVQAAKNSNLDKEISISLKNNKTYKERIEAIVNTEVDIKVMLVNMNRLINDRIEQVFDKIQQSPENIKPDYILIKYMEIMLNFAEKYDKIVNQSPDQIIQHNVSVQVMDQYVVLLQNCIRDTLAEIDPEASSLFLERFNENIAKLTLPNNLEPAKPMTQQNRLMEAQILSEVANAIPTITSNDITFPEV